MSSEVEPTVISAVERGEAAQKAHLLFLTAWFEVVGAGMGEAEATQWLGCTTERLQGLLIGSAKPTVEELVSIADQLGVELGSWL